jgi:hypothetical protein
MSQSAAVRTARAPRPVPRHQGRQLRPVPGTGRSTQSPRLRVVSAARHTRSRAGLVVACLALLVLGLVGLLLLDVSLERGAYDLQAQGQRAEQLREQAQKIRSEIVEQEAPQNLEQKARQEGMVPAPGAPVFVLPGGRTIGVPQRAVAPPSPSVTPSSASGTAKSGPSATASPRPGDAKAGTTSGTKAGTTSGAKSGTTSGTGATATRNGGTTTRHR